MSFLLDTNVISEGAKPRPDPGVMGWLDAADEERLFLSVVSLAELRHGIERMSDGKRKAALDVWLTEQLAPRFEDRLLHVDADTADEWGRVVAQGQGVLDLARQLDRGARAVAADGHSDYGNALETFWARCGRDVSHRTTVLILGDARNNRHLPATWVLREMSRRTGHLFWLNPEPRAQWGTGDSVMAEYASYCDTVAECRNLRQLENFVTSQLLEPAAAHAWKSM